MGEYDYRREDGTFVKRSTAPDDPVRECQFCDFDEELEYFDKDGGLVTSAVLDDDVYESGEVGVWEGGPFCCCREKNDPYGGGAAACEGVDCGFYRPELKVVK